MAGRRWTYLTALLISVLFYLSYQEWLSWLFLMLMVFLPVFSFLVSLPAMGRFLAGVSAPEGVSLGMEAQAKLVGWCDLPVPPFRGRLRVTRILTGEQFKCNTAAALPTDHCGGLEVMPEKVRVYDYLGLTGLRVRKLRGQTVLVRPRPVAIREIPNPERFAARSWRPKPGGGFSENHELRLYRPGDSLNQVHWKLSAKTGKLILREPMQPIRGRVLVTMNLRGTPEELDRKLGRLLWLTDFLLNKELFFELRVLTGDGVRIRNLSTHRQLEQVMDELLCAAPAAQGDLRQLEYAASWRYHIGGEPDEP